MTSKAEWLALAERCEKAMEPDCQLELQLLSAAIGKRWHTGSTTVPRYTSSLDAITALIERELPNAGWSAHKEYYDVIEGRIMRRGQDMIVRYGATPALSLCAAFCRAMAEAAE